MTREYAFEYDTTPAPEAFPAPDAALIPIESTTDGGIIAWATDAEHAAAIVAALRAAELPYLRALGYGTEPPLSETHPCSVPGCDTGSIVDHQDHPEATA